MRRVQGTADFNKGDDKGLAEAGGEESFGTKYGQNSIPLRTVLDKDSRGGERHNRRYSIPNDYYEGAISSSVLPVVREGMRSKHEYLKILD